MSFKSNGPMVPLSQDRGEIAIRIKNVVKRYQIYDTPRDRLKQFIVPRLNRLVGAGQKQYFREFAALNDVSFEVRKGETVGVIGRNGAGKSTLLQIICGTLTPTEGEIEISGRVAALLELGSGFNAEFTGRENIYMNAGVLGLTKEEIDARFDDIVAFADIGDFLDQPVKTYSSGMYVRLAFSVVVHVDADILIVDEALSVGDMYFQAKCMLKMKRMMESGVTVLFVSHDVGAVKAICDRAVYLDHGNVVLVGPTDHVIEAYYAAGVSTEQASHRQEKNAAPMFAEAFNADDIAKHTEFAARAGFHRVQNGMAEFLTVELVDEHGRKAELMNFGATAVLKMVFKSNVDLASVGLAYHIRDKNGIDIVYSDTAIEKYPITNLKAREVVTLDWEFKIYLRQGDYTVAAMLSIPQNLMIGKVEVCDFVPLAFNFQVVHGKTLPIYGAVYWGNKVSLLRNNRIER